MQPPHPNYSQELLLIFKVGFETLCFSHTTSSFLYTEAACWVYLFLPVRFQQLSSRFDWSCNYHPRIWQRLLCNLILLWEFSKTLASWNCWYWQLQFDAELYRQRRSYKIILSSVYPMCIRLQHVKCDLFLYQPVCFPTQSFAVGFEIGFWKHCLGYLPALGIGF